MIGPLARHAGDFRTLPLGEEEAGFSPASLAGLVLWLDAADPSTLYQNSGLTTRATADNDPVGGWVDKSGRGTHAVQATNGWRPLLKLNQQNGKPMIVNDGVDDMFFLATTLNLSDFSIVATVRSSADIRAVLGNSASNYQVRLNYLSTNKLSVYSNGTPVGVSSLLTSPISSTSVLEWARQGSTSLYYQNGLAAGTSTVSTAAMVLDTILSFSGSIEGVMNLGELIVLNRSMTAQERTQVVSWLTRKWGV